MGNACRLGRKTHWEQRFKTIKHDEIHSRGMKEDHRHTETDWWRWIPKIKDKDLGKEKSFFGY